MANSSGSVSYEVKFILPANKSQTDVSDNLKLSFEAMDCNNLEPAWIKEEECLKIQEKQAKLFVCDPFEGLAFEHLVSLNCRIMGPLCILTCLAQGETLPKRSYPVYSLAMRKISITCSNVNKQEREEISRKVSLMGGLFSKDLTKSVTHLIVGEVGSKKYHVAANFNIPIMLPEWVQECWNTEQYNQRHAADPLFDKFRCPIFKGLTITVSQLSSDERRTVQELIRKNGGQYSGILKAKETTHLVLAEPLGEKYKFARAWKLFCVKVEWLYDSLNAGHCMDEMLYKLEAKPREHGHSTPKKEDNGDECNKQDLAPDCSSIEDVSIMSKLDETAQSDVTIIPTKRKLEKQMDNLNCLDVSKLPKANQFLDGCRIFLSGFHGSNLDKLHKIISAGGGARFSKLNESVTHVILGERDPELIKNIVDSSVRPHVVSYNWLVDCCKQQKLLDEGAYTCLQNIPLSPDVKSQKPSSHPPCKKTVPSQNISVRAEEDYNDIMKQYLPCDQTTSETSEFHKEAKLGESELPLAVDEIINKDLKDVEKEACTENSSPDRLFINLTFMIFGFGPKDAELLTDMIEEGCGTKLNSSVHSCADVGIVPITGCEVGATVKEVVTNCWLQMCTESEKLLPFDSNPLFRPIHVQENCKPLESCVLSFSQYTGTERDCLMHLAEMLGAHCQEYFVHKSNKIRKLLPNTHLVVSIPEGTKYEAAKKWKIPAVTKYWLFAAAKKGIKPKEDRFLVEIHTDENTSETDSENTDDISVIKTKPVLCASESSSYKSNAKFSEREPEIHLKNVREYDVPSVDQNQYVKESIEQREQSKVLHESIIRHDPELENAREVCDVPSAQNQRIKELIEREQPTVLHKSFIGNSETPNKFLNPNTEFRPNYDVNGLLESLDSSGSQASQGAGRRKRKSSLPLEELFSHNMEAALKKFGHGDFQDNEKKERNDEKVSEQMGCSSNESDFCNPVCIPAANLKPKPLSGVVIYVAKKLSTKQGELYNIVNSLGGDYRWSYDSSCTHFIFQGRANDITREFRIAREHGKKIVSPEWVYSCRDSEAWIDESLYPHTHNPQMSLSGHISAKKVSILSAPSQNCNGEIIQRTDLTTNSCHKIADKESSFAEGRSDVSKQLEEFLTAAKCVKTNKRWSRRLNSSGSTSPVGGETSRSKLQNSVKLQGSENQLGKDRILPPPSESVPTEASQSIPIIWDDPTGRLEREKIAEQLARGTNTQDTQSQSPDEMLYDVMQEGQNSEDLMKNADCAEEVRASKQVPKFMLSGLSEKEKENCMTVIEELGGMVSDEKASDVTATHLILGQPLKNEKYLAAVASGIWVLHRSYLEACKEAGQFVDEEAHEWGGTATYQIVQKLPEKLAKVALCPRRWRISLSQSSDKKKAFQGWKVIVIAEKQKALTYGRILTAGGADLLTVEPPYSDCQQATHALIELPKNALTKVDLVSLVSNGVSCLKPEYLAFYLVEDPSPPEKDYAIPQVLELLQNLPSESGRVKRKTNANVVRTNANTKRCKPV